jgi:hypothetical protein
VRKKTFLETTQELHEAWEALCDEVWKQIQASWEWKKLSSWLKKR